MASNELQRSRHGGVVCFRRRLPEDLPLLGARRQVYRPLNANDRRAIRPGR